MPPCLMAKKASSDTYLMFQFYLPYYIKLKRKKEVARSCPLAEIENKKTTTTICEACINNEINGINNI